jgi:hypothetical protein
MIDAPSGISGSAFYTVNSTPFDVDVENRIVQLLGDRSEGSVLGNPRIREENIESALLIPDLRIEAFQIVDIRYVSTHPARIPAHFFDRSGEFPFATSSDVRVGTLCG